MTIPKDGLFYVTVGGSKHRRRQSRNATARHRNVPFCIHFRYTRSTFSIASVHFELRKSGFARQYALYWFMSSITSSNISFECLRSRWFSSSSLKRRIRRREHRASFSSSFFFILSISDRIASIAFFMLLLELLLTHCQNPVEPNIATMIVTTPATSALISITISNTALISVVSGIAYRKRMICTSCRY